MCDTMIIVTVTWSIPMSTMLPCEIANALNEQTINYNVFYEYFSKGEETNLGFFIIQGKDVKQCIAFASEVNKILNEKGVGELNILTT